MDSRYHKEYVLLATERDFKESIRKTIKFNETLSKETINELFKVVEDYDRLKQKHIDYIMTVYKEDLEVGLLEL
jgi:hypothetical protein